VSFLPGITGNPAGRPANPWRERLEIAISHAEKKVGKSFLVHCAELAFEDVGMAKDLLRKFVPDCKELHIDGVSELAVGIRSAFTVMMQHPELCNTDANSQAKMIENSSEQGSGV
jgi:hypothetical protein